MKEKPGRTIERLDRPADLRSDFFTDPNAIKWAQSALFFESDPNQQRRQAQLSHVERAITSETKPEVMQQMLKASMGGTN